VARTHDAALLLLHHVRKSDGTYRDSSEIAAAVDCLLTLATPGLEDAPNERRITGRARWTVEPYTVALRHDCYELSSGAELSIDARVLLHVEANPGTSRNATRKAVRARGSAVDGEINRLLVRGAIENHGSEDRMKLFLPSPQVEWEAPK
jgi:hypothetical protein